MDVALPAILVIVILGSAFGLVMWGSLWLWSLPWHADEDVAE